MIIRNPLVTNGKGSMANMTFVGIENGGVIAKGKIVNMTNPNTYGQSSTRWVFAFLVAQFKVMKSILDILNPSNVPRVSPFNKFMSNNVTSLKEQITEQGTQIEYTDANQAVLTLKEQLGEPSGNVDSNVLTEVTTQPTFTGVNATVDIEWDPQTSNPNAVQGDKLVIIVFNAAMGYYKTDQPGLVRSDGTGSIGIERPLLGYNVYYYTWKSATEDVYSDSFGILAVPATGNVLFVQTAELA